MFSSDLANGAGTEISGAAWNGARDELYRAESWPIFSRLSRPLWQIWQRCLKRAFISRGRRLKVPLGDWVVHDQDWPWYITTDGAFY
jgi:hypothetical protein